MSLLVGQNGTGWTNAVGGLEGNGGNLVYFHSGYTAVATGTMTKAHFSLWNLAAGSTLGTVYVYSGVGPGSTLLATSGEMTLAVGDNSAAISGTITSGNSYTLCFQAASGYTNAIMNSGTSTSNDNQNTVATFPYRSPPTTMPAFSLQSGPEFIIWIDGTSVVATGPAMYQLKKA